MLSDGETRYVVVSTEAMVVHEEHAPLRIRAATYKVRIQREYAPEGPDLWRDVAD